MDSGGIDAKTRQHKAQARCQCAREGRLAHDRQKENRQQCHLANAENELAAANVYDVGVPVSESRGRSWGLGIGVNPHPFEQLTGAAKTSMSGSYHVEVRRGASRHLVRRPHREQTTTALATQKRALTDETQPPRVVRVRAVLDAVTVSTRSIVLRLETGRILLGFATAVPLEDLRQLLGADVVVEGVVAFEPSGDALRMEVESMATAQPRDSIWASMPAEPTMMVRPAWRGAGLDAWSGRWPGDETDVELSDAMR